MKILTVIALTLLTLNASAEWVNLWPGDAPGAKPQAVANEKNQDGRLGDIAVPQISVSFPDKAKATGAAVVVFPGGGYTMLAADHEGSQFASWLNERGIVSIMVKYRVSGNDAYGYGFPVPFLDARRAIRTVRAKADEWGVDPKRIGVLGFSAGGHLASLCVTRFGDTFPEEGKDAIDQQDCRPDFGILGYPVISMSDPLAHQGSRRRLLGDTPSVEQIEKYSTDKQVSKETPPMFLVHTSDDGVDCRNSLAFATACKDHGVPVTLHLFEKGGHGYGLHGKGDVSAWPQLLEKWLAEKTAK
ncbi:MAG: alpha/beta hydrolase [Verrucomicrobiota bacterium]